MIRAGNICSIYIGHGGARQAASLARLRKSSSALVHDEGIANFKPPQARHTRLIGTDAIERHRRYWMVFVVERPTRGNRGVEDERHQYLCPSCRAKRSSSIAARSELDKLEPL